MVARSGPVGCGSPTCPLCETVDFEVEWAKGPEALDILESLLPPRSSVTYEGRMLEGQPYTYRVKISVGKGYKEKVVGQFLARLQQWKRANPGMMAQMDFGKEKLLIQPPAQPSFLPPNFPASPNSKPGNMFGDQRPLNPNELQERLAAIQESWAKWRAAQRNSTNETKRAFGQAVDAYTQPQEGYMTRADSDRILGRPYSQTDRPVLLPNGQISTAREQTAMDDNEWLKQIKSPKADYSKPTPTDGNKEIEAVFPLPPTPAPAPAAPAQAPAPAPAK